jgi:nucleoside phosphorylase
MSGVGQPQDLADFASEMLSQCQGLKKETLQAIVELLKVSGVSVPMINRINLVSSQLGPQLESPRKVQKKASQPPKIGIITALPKEMAAVRAILSKVQRPRIKRAGGMKEYYVGSIPDRSGGEHRVALGLAGMGNNQAAARATNLLRDFPSVKTIVMVGIAGGIPNPEKPEHHVRLGDVVVSGEPGIIQYDLVKDTDGQLEYRFPARPPSASLLEAARIMEAEMLGGADPISVHVKKAIAKLGWRRPPANSDILYSSDDPSLRIPHPRDTSRVVGKPRVFISPIASANVLLKNSRRREEIRDRFGVKAVEMESSGIADSTWDLEVTYFAIRGICDYCNTKKNDLWQQYAALIAAAYARTLLESIASL